MSVQVPKQNEIVVLGGGIIDSFTANRQAFFRGERNGDRHPRASYYW
jgi:hypothetical protein